VSPIENRAAGNPAVVGGIYEAFGRGDIDFILDQIADDCAWESWLDNHGQKAGIPPMRPRHGREGVAEFFDYVATMRIRDFQVLDLLASDRQVVVEVQISIAMADSDTVTDEELHLYSLNDEGKIIRMRHYVDTAKQIEPTGWAAGVSVWLERPALCRRRVSRRRLKRETPALSPRRPHGRGCFYSDWRAGRRSPVPTPAGP
jgi:uncharacterized protein